MFPQKVEIHSFKYFQTSNFLGSQLWIGKKLLVGPLIENESIPFLCFKFRLRKSSKKKKKKFQGWFYQVFL